MNQIKIGGFLKDLRKEKGLTQEQLAERFNISARTVSRWETGSNMPDLSILVEMADFYEVEIKEIIDGERKSEVENGLKETLEKVADYSNEYSRKKVNRVWKIVFALLLILVLIIVFIPTKLILDDAGGNTYGGDISKVTTKAVSSDLYSQVDIDAAIKTIEDEFESRWSNCTLNEIYYAGDEASCDRTDDYAEDVIVLMSSFYVDKHGYDSFNSDYTYDNWSWILIRSKDGEWKHIDHGY